MSMSGSLFNAIRSLFKKRDRKITSLNSSHFGISYAVFCLIDYIYVCFNELETNEIYTLSLHDALPIFRESAFCLEGGETADDGTVLAAVFLENEFHNVVFQVVSEINVNVGQFVQRHPFLVQETRSEDHKSELQSLWHLVCRLLLDRLYLCMF